MKPGLRQAARKEKKITELEAKICQIKKDRLLIDEKGTRIGHLKRSLKLYKIQLRSGNKQRIEISRKSNVTFQSDCSKSVAIRSGEEDSRHGHPKLMSPFPRQFDRERTCHNGDQHISESHSSAKKSAKKDIS